MKKWISLILIGCLMLLGAALAEEKLPTISFAQTKGSVNCGMTYALEVQANPSLALDYHVAVPRMSHYIECSTRIYNIYLKYIAPEDIHVYSIDEVLIDATHYLKTYRLTARELARKMMSEIFQETGITATAGIGTNLYLAKVAMDIVAKHAAPDQYGARVAELDEMSYRKKLWDHRPLTDFWRVGKGTVRKLESYALYTMGDIARCSIGDEDLLYRLFGINAELLIDHAWGWEPCTMEAIKAYRPEFNSLSSGQVLQEPYTFQKARVVTQEMAEAMALDLLDKKLVTDQVVLTVGYDRESLADPAIGYTGEVTTDYYGRSVPKHAHGTENLARLTSSARLITQAAMALYDRHVNPRLLIRRINITVNHVEDETAAGNGYAPGTAHAAKESRTAGGDWAADSDQAAYADRAPSPFLEEYEQLDFFTDYEAREQQRRAEEEQLEKERKLGEAVLSIKKKYGKNALLKGINYEEGATGRQRNQQVGGHKA